MRPDSEGVAVWHVALGAQLLSIIKKIQIFQIHVKKDIRGELDIAFVKDEIKTTRTQTGKPHERRGPTAP